LTDGSIDKIKPILLLDEVTEDALLIKHFLQKLGLLIYVFTNPLLALDHFQLNNQNYSSVISDIRMSSITGIEFARKARKINPSVKIFLTSSFKADNESRLSKLLASIKIDGFFHKPISSDELKDAFEKHIYKNNNQNHLRQKYSQKMISGTRTLKYHEIGKSEACAKSNEEKAHNYNRFDRTIYYLIRTRKGGYNRARILQMLNSQPSNTHRIAHDLKLHYKTVLFHIGVLSRYKLISNDIEGAYGATYFLTPIMKRRYGIFLEILSELEQRVPVVSR
jgi:response regulator RpfG family c-di-GMP phosphodiesterase